MEHPSIFPLSCPILLEFLDYSLFEPASHGIDLAEHKLTLCQSFEIWVGRLLLLQAYTHINYRITYVYCMLLKSNTFFEAAKTAESYGRASDADTARTASF